MVPIVGSGDVHARGDVATARCVARSVDREIYHGTKRTYRAARQPTRPPWRWVRTGIIGWTDTRVIWSQAACVQRDQLRTCWDGWMAWVWGIWHHLQLELRDAPSAHTLVTIDARIDLYSISGRCE